MRLALRAALAAAVLAVVVSGAANAGQAGADSLAEQSHQAREFMAAGRFDRAIPLYRALTRALPDNAGLAFDLGLALHMAGREREAATVLRRSLALDPDSLPARLYLGNAELSLGRPAAAVPLLRAVLRAKPEEAAARQSLAAALLELGHGGEAAAEYRRSIGNGPGTAAAWYGLGRSYAAIAQHAFDRLGRAAPGSAYWLALAAGARAKAGQLSGAFYLYRQAQAKLPSLPGLHAAVAAIYRQSGHADWAAAEAARERPLDGSACERQPLACAYQAGSYDRILAAAAATPAALYWRARAADRLAIQAFARLGDFPDSAERHELLATLHANALDYTQAAAEWRAAYERSGHDPAIGTQLALAWMQLHDFADAEPLLETLRRQQPDSAQLSFLLGYVRLQQQQPQRAIPLLAASLRADPALANAQRALAEAYLETGQTKLAIPHLQAALPLDDDGSLHYQLARAYQAGGATQQAQAALREYQRLHQAAESAKQTAQAQVQILPPQP